MSEQYRWPKISITIQHSKSRSQTIHLTDFKGVIRNRDISIEAKIGTSRSGTFSLVEHDKWVKPEPAKAKKARK